MVRLLGRRRASAYPESPSHAARVLQFLFDTVVPLSRRIDHRGRPRPAWHALLDALAELRMPAASR